MPIFGDSGPILLALTVGIFAPLSGWTASRRARNPIVWFAIGACSGPVALFILAVAPPGRCPDCDRPVPRWNRVCARCGAEFPPIWEEEEAPAATPAPAARAAPAATPAPAARAAPAAPAPAATSAATPRRPRAQSRTRREPAAPAGPATNGSRAPKPTRRGSPGGTHAVETPAETPVEAPPRPVFEPAPPRPVAVPPRPVFEPAPPVRRPAPAPSAPLDDDEVRVLSTGIYILGNAGLEVGARYGLARVGDRLRVFGPVDLGEVTVRHERPLAELEVTGIGDQLIVSMASRGSGLAMVFQGLGGMQPADLERALAGPDAQEGRSGALPS